VSAETLASEYTARELAQRASAAEARVEETVRRSRIAFDALRSIARHEWTAEGAAQRARDAIEEAKRASPP
jgi:hypothetical protein